MDRWITDPQELQGLPRLQEVLIRYRGTTEGRLSTSAQYAADLIAMLEATGRYVRDISIQSEQEAEPVAETTKGSSLSVAGTSLRIPPMYRRWGRRLVAEIMAHRWVRSLLAVLFVPVAIGVAYWGVFSVGTDRPPLSETYTGVTGLWPYLPLWIKRGFFALTVGAILVISWRISAPSK